MASSPITSYSQTKGGKVEAVTDFIFLKFIITADSDFIHEIKRHLLLGRKAMTNLDSILKSRGITLQSNYITEALHYKAPSSQSYGFFQ